MASGNFYGQGANWQQNNNGPENWQQAQNNWQRQSFGNWDQGKGKGKGKGQNNPVKIGRGVYDGLCLGDLHDMNSYKSQVGYWRMQEKESYTFIRNCRLEGHVFDHKLGDVAPDYVYGFAQFAQFEISPGHC